MTLVRGIVFNFNLLKYNLIIHTQFIKFFSEKSQNSWHFTKVSLGLFGFVVFIQFLLDLMQRFSLANYYFCCYYFHIAVLENVVVYFCRNFANFL